MIFRIYGGDITHKHAKFAPLGVIRYKVKNVQDLLFRRWDISDAGGQAC
jgi:hypothetical protein